MKKSSIAGSLIVVGLLFLPGTSADLQDCVNQCIAQFEADRVDCLQSYQGCLQTVAGEFSDCMDAAGNDPLAQYACFRTSSIQQDNCEREADQCQALANTTAADCYRTCQSSWLNP